MERRDHLLRQIEQLGRALARIREMLFGGEVAKAREELHEIARQTGVELGLANALSHETLLMLLSDGGSLDRARATAVAQILEVDALRAEKEGDSAWAERSRTAAQAIEKRLGG